MFWRFGGHASVSTLDQILDKPDVTLEELLDESDLIQELKQQNSRLIEFLREDDALQKLLRYVIAEPLGDPQDATVASPEPGQAVEEDVSTELGLFGKVNARSRSKTGQKDPGESDEQKSEAQRRKFSYVSCEILSSEVWSITEALLADTSHLREFWDYLRRPAPLDPLQASYFTKINETLLDKKTEEMFAFLQTLDAVVPEMLKHVDCPMIMDLLLKMISLEKHEGGRGIVDWLQSQGLLLILLSYLSPDNPPSHQTSAGDFLKAIVTISANATAQDQTVIGPNELTRQLVSKPCVEQLIGYMLSGGNPLTVGVGIIIEVIRKNNSDYDGEFQPGPEPHTSDPIYLGVLLRAFSEHLEHFMTLIRSPSAAKPQLKTAFGASLQPLGFDRFKTCELMAELLHCSNMGLLNERGSDAELTARDAERQRLKSEGKLPGPPAHGADDSTVQYGSSVDSHGYHHAQAPQHPEKSAKLEIQNATDEDGFEKLAVPEAEPLPDEVSFDDLLDNVQDTKEERDPDKASDEAADRLRQIKLASDDGKSQSISTDGPRRVSSLTKQIEQEIEGSVRSPEDETAAANQTEKDAASNPEDRPAPLFARTFGTQQGDDDPNPESPDTSRSGPDDSTVDDETITLLSPAVDPSTHDDCLYERDVDGTPVIGDLLKMQFVEHQVVPTILDFFFRFPWNNFLHNVVYDVVQQVFNGNLDHGYNRQLARDLFKETPCSELSSQANIVQRVLDGQKASERSETESRMRLGYMGHLTLIAEEICKFVDRYDPAFLSPEIKTCIGSDAWMQYVGGVLAHTRERDNAVLGGTRPVSDGVESSQAALLGPVSIANNGNSSALADAGLTGGSAIDELSLSEPETAEGYDVESLRSSDMPAGAGTGDINNDKAPDGNDSKPGGMTLDDDEQFSDQDYVGDSPTSPISPSIFGAQASTIPAPLNIPPSRARKQLAARLAARQKENQAAGSPSGANSAASSENGSPSSLDSPSSFSGSPVTRSSSSPCALRLQTDLGNASPVSGPVFTGRAMQVTLQSTGRSDLGSPGSRARLQTIFNGGSGTGTDRGGSSDSIESQDSAELSDSDGSADDPAGSSQHADAQRPGQADHDDGSELMTLPDDNVFGPGFVRPGQGPVSTPSDLVGPGFDKAPDTNRGRVSGLDAADGRGDAAIGSGGAARFTSAGQDEEDEGESSDEGDVVEIGPRRTPTVGGAGSSGT